MLTKYKGVSVPLRGLWFLSLNEEGVTDIAQATVSVPLRGLWFLSFVSNQPRGKYKVVSVPLRGLWFLSTDELLNVVTDVKFPSPYGDYGSYRERTMKTMLPRPGGVSVPLRGLWFLSAPFINGFMKPLKWHFAGRIIYFHHFSSFVRK